MKNCFLKSILATVFSLTIMLPSAQATLITSTFGTSPSGFTNGQILTFLDLLGKPDFGTGTNGSDPIENFDRSWEHSFGPISGTILSASITLGIYDHDSAHTGSQLSSFMLDTTEFSTGVNGLNALFESSGGANNQYNLYSISLPPSFFSSLIDGSMLSTLTLMGPVLSPGLPGITPDQIDSFNGAKLILSQLEIDVQDPMPVPEPNTIFLLLGAIVLLTRFNYLAK
ncbi:MAG: hypothetical protein RPR97_10495 [Colwellia sp.]